MRLIICNYLTEARWIKDWLEALGQTAFYAPNAVDHDIFRPTREIIPRGERLRVLIEGPLAYGFKRVKAAFAAVDGLDVEVWCVSSGGTLEPWMHPDVFFSARPSGEDARDILLL